MAGVVESNTHRQRAFDVFFEENSSVGFAGKHPAQMHPLHIWRLTLRGTERTTHQQHTPMLKHVIQLSGAFSLLALTASAQDTQPVEYVKVSDLRIKPSGYIVGSYQYTKSDAEFSSTGSPSISSDSSSDRFDLDAAKVLFAMDYKPVTGAFSVFYPGGSGSDIYVLDAYATYDFGNGSSITGGKFLSWLGYEAFDIPNMAQITYAYANFNPIPGYHSGLKYNYTSPEVSFGVALLDSLYSPTAFKGDGSLKTDFAFEAFASYTGVPGLTLWGGLGYQSEDDETLLHR
jgi:hypothetical protein